MPGWLLTSDLTTLPQIEESEEEWGVPHCLTLRGQRQSIIVAAR